MNKQETYDYLKNCGVAFEITEHPAVWNMEDVAQLEMPHPEADAKNLFVREDKTQNYHMITVRGDKRVDLKALRKAPCPARRAFPDGRSGGTSAAAPP